MPRRGVQISGSACPAEEPTNTHLRQPGRYEAGQRIPLIGRTATSGSSAGLRRCPSRGARSIGGRPGVRDRYGPHLDQRNIGVDPLLRADALCEGCGTSSSSKGTKPRTDNLDNAASFLTDAVVEDGDAGVYRATRRIFTDEDIFELEM